MCVATLTSPSFLQHMNCCMYLSTIHVSQGTRIQGRTAHVHIYTLILFKKEQKSSLKLIVVLSVSSYDSSATHILKFTQDTTLGLEFGVGVGSTIKDVMH